MRSQGEYRLAMLRLEVAFAGLFFALDHLLAAAEHATGDDQHVTDGVDRIKKKMAQYFVRAPHLKTFFEE